MQGGAYTRNLIVLAASTCSSFHSCPVNLRGSALLQTRSVIQVFRSFPYEGRKMGIQTRSRFRKTVQRYAK
ncbi:hypothetical protein FH972_025164 [Carpinus fangiana]|uniref:Uncharacterized protein n=1 Tax=Carpinus fangiana TaxID=176857 RepID=A0A5N6L155_9ROSI|nr:hypothetical protein FH972_025164 [Carpinus fangiana]